MSAILEGTAESLAEELGAALDRAGAARPAVALVLGSGLGAFADTFGIERAILLAPAMAVGALALLAFGDDGDELGPSQLR